MTVQLELYGLQGTSFRWRDRFGGGGGDLIDPELDLGASAFGVVFGDRRAGLRPFDAHWRCKGGSGDPAGRGKVDYPFAGGGLGKLAEAAVSGREYAGDVAVNGYPDV
ncbi:hypothetical protein [Azotobacter beijerinckii]|uniref:hypothetical protein n=1 Tax=Azotobacter beijerinckii TaxID=170623 RepID=UPI001160E23F|nr:hypothetical protein [Azotobacter beijerinckii]